MSLANEYRRHAPAPDFLYGRQDSHFVIDQYIMHGWVPGLHVPELQFFVDVNQNLSLHRLKKSRAINFARLEHDVAIA